MSSELFTPKPKEGEAWDVAIVGSGPAALTASIYTTRGAASTLLLAGSVWGGQLMLTTTVDNFPGFPEGVQGPDLMQLMRRQAERFGAEFVEVDLTSVDFTSSPFTIKTTDKTYQAKSLIVATGANAKWLKVPGEDKLRGRGVSSCAPCDAPFFKDKKVAVVGGGDSAMEEALVLSKYASEVVLIHRRDKFRASAHMQQKVLSNPKISTLWNTQVLEVLGDNQVTGLKLLTEGKGEWQLPLMGMFVAIGHVPATEPFKESLSLDELGYLVKTSKPGFASATNIDGVFTAGDVHDNHYRQAITAAGFGAMAALDALRFLDKDIPTW